MKEEDNASNKKEENTKQKAPTKPKELSEEDKEYKKNLDTMVQGLLDPDPDIRMNSFNLIENEIRSSTASMTSIPRPLKFFLLHYNEIKSKYDSFVPQNQKDEEYKNSLTELLAILVMVVRDTEDTSLGWILKGKNIDITKWGQEFISHLCSDIATEYNNRLENGVETEELYKLVKLIVPYQIKQHYENEAIDLLIEVEKLNDMLNFVNESNYKKICLYLLANANYAADTDEYRSILELVYSIYLSQNEYVNALRVGIKIGYNFYIKQVLSKCTDPITQKQLAFILAREKIYIENEEFSNDFIEVMSNLKLSGYYREVGKELKILDPKHPDEVFKTHLEDTKSDAKLESITYNMAISIASSFINAGYGSELLLGKEKSNWLYKNKEVGVITLLGGLGLVHLWDIDEGFGKLYEYAGVNEKDIFKRSGRNLGMGICSSGVHEDNGTAITALLEELEDSNMIVKIYALLGLAMAAAGTQNEDLKAPLLKVFQDFKYGFELSAVVSLTLGLIFLGSAKDDILDDLFSILLTRNNEGKAKLIENPFFTLYALGMGLICLGKQKDIDLMIETISTLEDFSESMRMYLKVMLTSFAYAGTGNVTKVQEMIQVVAKPKKEIDPKVQSIAVVGCSIIAMGEEVGAEMLIRTFNHFLQFGNNSVKKSVSLAIALLNLSNSKVHIIDSLTKFCYDQDKEIAINAIFSLGLVSCGTNHSRVAGLLRSLAGFYYEDNDVMFIIRITQGLLHLGKGLLTINPLYSHNLILNNVGTAGILVTLFSFTETKELITKKYQSLLYFLTLAMQPRIVMTLDEKLQSKPVQLMIGQGIDIAGQTGNPRTIAGFQIHTSPALMAAGERCELSGDDYTSYTNVLENFVIIKEKERK